MFLSAAAANNSLEMSSIHELSQCSNEPLTISMSFVLTTCPSPSLPSPCRKDTTYKVTELYHALNRFEHGDPFSDGEDQFVSPSLQKGETKKASLKQAGDTGAYTAPEAPEHARALALSQVAPATFGWWTTSTKGCCHWC